MKEGTGRTLGGTARMAGLAAVLVLAGLIPGGKAVADAQRADVTLGYTCRFPSSGQPAIVRIKGAFPASGAAGSLLRPEGVSVAVTLPRTALSESSDSSDSSESSGIASAVVAGSVSLDTLITQAGRPIGVEWADLTVPRTAVKVSDLADTDLTLAAEGAVPPVTATAAGDAVFSAGGLRLRLTFAKAGGAEPAPPAEVTIACTPNLGQNTTIVTVPVAGRERSPANTVPIRTAPGVVPGRNTTAAGPGDGDPCPPMPEGGYNPAFPLPDWEPGSEPWGNGEPQPGCALVDGLSNVSKLKGASRVRGTAAVLAGTEQRFKNASPADPDGYTQVRNLARSYFDTTQATFLTFGFMPTTAKMEITQIGNANVVAIGPFADVAEPKPTVTTAWAEVSIRIFDVKINGSPMDVGPNCRTSRTMALILTGSDQADPPYRVNSGGRLSGTVEIPPFSGCGVGDDLDRLFTASVSGPGNYVEVIQGPVCDTTTSGGANTNPCPPAGYGYTITPGGAWNGTSGPADIRVGLSSRRTNVQCRSTALAGTFRSGSRVPPEKLGRVAGMQFKDCTGTGLLPGPVTVEPTGLPWNIKENPAGLDAKTGILEVQLQAEALHVTAGACSFDIAGPKGLTLTARYSNNDNSPDIGPGELRIDAKSLGNIKNSVGCPSQIRIGTATLLEALRYPELGQKFSYGDRPD